MKWREDDKGPTVRPRPDFSGVSQTLARLKLDPLCVTSASSDVAVIVTTRTELGRTVVGEAKLSVEQEPVIGQTLIDMRGRKPAWEGISYLA